ncbi:unnamed protein product [Durusdinium trenchii]|uniref:Uncharacterized protein n=1 Tax=Durusdinium trenchii TaxID=1381693 RepID=A0ABP0JUG9_9DINO
MPTGWKEPDSPSSRRSYASYAQSKNEDLPVRRRSPPKKVDALDQQEALFCQDMRRLTRVAKACAEDALRELKSLRSEADDLRKQLKSLTSSNSQDGSPARSQARRREPRLAGRLSAR